MHRSVRSALALAALCFGPLACGGGTSEGTPDAGAPVADPAAWGLADKTCWRYTDSSNQVAYTIEISVDDKITVVGVKTYQLLHRYNGFEQRREWLEVTPDSLLLHRRSIGAPPDLQLFTPPVVFLKQNIQEGDAVETATSVKVANASGTTTKDGAFTVSNLGPDTLHLPAGDTETTKYSLGLTGVAQNGGTDRVWFVPKQGIVKFNPAGTDVEDVLFHDTYAVDNSHPCNTL